MHFFQYLQRWKQRNWFWELWSRPWLTQEADTLRRWLQMAKKPECPEELRGHAPQIIWGRSCQGPSASSAVEMHMAREDQRKKKHTLFCTGMIIQTVGEEHTHFPALKWSRARRKQFFSKQGTRAGKQLQNVWAASCVDIDAICYITITCIDQVVIMLEKIITYKTMCRPVLSQLKILFFFVPWDWDLCPCSLCCPCLSEWHIAFGDSICKGWCK